MGGFVLPAILGLGASIWGSSEAARAQKKAGKKALSQQQAQYQETRAAQEPYRRAGATALKSLTDITAQGPGGPTYEWRRQEEEKALEAQMRAAGTWSSGRAAEAGARIGQQLTAEETQAHQARLQSLAELGSGQTTTRAGTSTQPYYAVGQAGALVPQAIGQGISTLAGTWAAERERRAEEERRRLAAGGGGAATPGLYVPNIMTA